MYKELLYRLNKILFVFLVCALGLALNQGYEEETFKEKEVEESLELNWFSRTYASFQKGEQHQPETTSNSYSKKEYQTYHDELKHSYDAYIKLFLLHCQMIFYH